MRKEGALLERTTCEKLNNDLLVGNEIKFCKLFAIAPLYLSAVSLRSSEKRERCLTMNIAYYGVDKLTFSTLIPNNFSPISFRINGHIS